MGQHSPRMCVAGAGVAVLLVGLCCHSSEQLITLDRSDNGRTVAVEVGDQFEVALESVGPGRFASPVVSSGSVRFLSESESSPSGPSTPGGGKTQKFRFEAFAPGRSEIAIPFDPTGWTFAFTVQVY